MLLRLTIGGARLSLALRALHVNRRTTVFGHNMATRAQAYDEVGGFQRTSIDDMDEDVDYTVKVADRFGRHAIRFDPALQVATSMRRVRAYGVGGTILYHLFPSTRKNHKGNIDVR